MHSHHLKKVALLISFLARARVFRCALHTHCGFSFLLLKLTSYLLLTPQLSAQYAMVSNTPHQHEGISSLLHKRVQIYGLTRTPTLNGKQGVVFTADTQRQRCGVRVDSKQQYSVHVDNLRLCPLRPPDDMVKDGVEGFTHWDAQHAELFRTCYARCGAEAAVRNAMTRSNAEKICDRMLAPCGRCHESFYCSRQCQKKHWPKHKEGCNVVANATSFFETLTTDGGNRSLCTFVEECSGGERGVVHFTCPSPTTLEDMLQRKGVQTMPADTEYLQLDRLHLHDAQAEIQNCDFWDEVRNVVATYDVDLHICVLLSVTLSDGCFCRPAVLPRFFGSGPF